jgi:NAD(P)H-flavin reductase
LINIVLIQFKCFILNEGGTGITPMYQLIKDICNNSDDDTKLQLIFANQVKKYKLLYYHI